MAKELSFAEQLCYITTRIVTQDANKKTYIATGFFMAFQIEDKDETIPVLVTNRHVAENAETMTIWLSEKDKEGDPVDKSMIKVDISIKKGFIYHPNNAVDLAFYYIAPTITAVEEAIKKTVYYKTLPLEMVITDEKALALDAIEDVIMVGYPRGLWDNVNNRPIFRYGITATDPKVDYCDQREFMIDSACIQGSSGSPVLLFYKGVFCDKFGKNTCYDSLKVTLLGVQHAIPLGQTEGKIIKAETPTAENEDIPVIGLPINLGYIVKAQCLFDCIPLIEKECKVKLKHPQ